MKNLRPLLLILLVSILYNAPGLAKDKVTIQLINSASGMPGFLPDLKKEIDTLVRNRFQVEYQVLDLDVTNSTIVAKKLNDIFQDSSIDCVIGTSLDTSELLARWKNYTIPVISGVILDRKLQGLPMTDNQTSGVANFNYVLSPFDIEKDLRTFKRLVDFRHLAVLYNPSEVHMFHYFWGYMGKVMEQISANTKFSLVEIYPETVEGSINDIPQDVDGIYLPPLFMNRNTEKHEEIIGLINTKKIPSFALLGEEDVRLGAMASIAPDQNIKAVNRRMALNVLSILRGKNAADLPVSVVSYTDNFVVNMETLQKINYYPDWQALNDARLINLGESSSGRRLNIKGVIAEALERNLDLQIEKLDTELQNKEAKLALAKLYPQLSVSSSYTMIDEHRADGSPASPARYTWLLSGKLDQSIFTDDILANYTIQSKLALAQEHKEYTQVLDTVISAAGSFIDLLFTQTNRMIHNENLNVTRKNLDIAKNKEVVGSGSSSEVHRLTSEQANNQISLNDSHRDLQLARMSLNQLLNRPIKDGIQPEDIVIEESIELLVTDPEIFQLLQNFEDLSRFGNFLIYEADRNLPELKQVEASLEAHRREVLNKKRAYYLPDIQLSAGIDKTLGEYDNYSDTSSDLDHPWNITLSASWPLYDGNSRSQDLQLSTIRLKQTITQARNLRQQHHLLMRSNLEEAAVSAREIDLAQIRFDSASKNFDITQAGYSEGRNSITDLLDAQNAKLNAEQGKALARYQFVLDFLKLERSVGRFYFLTTPDQKESFLTRLHEFMNTTHEEDKG